MKFSKKINYVTVKPSLQQAYTMGIAELRRSVDTPTDDPRPVPLLEREERQAQQIARLRGVDCEAS